MEWEKYSHTPEIWDVRKSLKTRVVSTYAFFCPLFCISAKVETTESLTDPLHIVLAALIIVIKHDLLFVCSLDLLRKRTKKQLNNNIIVIIIILCSYYLNQKATNVS